MQIHELDSFTGTPSSTDYLAIDTGSNTLKIPATSIGVSTSMTQAEATAGTSTAKRVISPKVLKDTIDNAVSAISAIFESGTTSGWNWVKWSDGRYEAEKYVNIGTVTASNALLTVEGSTKLYVTVALPPSDDSPPHTLVSGNVVYDYVSNSSGYSIPIRSQNGKVQIGRFATDAFVFSNVTLVYRVVGGRWK